LLHFTSALAFVPSSPAAFISNHQHAYKVAGSYDRRWISSSSASSTSNPLSSATDKATPIQATATRVKENLEIESTILRKKNRKAATPKTTIILQRNDTQNLLLLLGKKRAKNPWRLEISLCCRSISILMLWFEGMPKIERKSSLHAFAPCIRMANTQRHRTWLQYRAQGVSG
jgi:hypothetical protein